MEKAQAEQLLSMYSGPQLSFDGIDHDNRINGFVVSNGTKWTFVSEIDANAVRAEIRAKEADGKFDSRQVFEAEAERYDMADGSRWRILGSRNSGMVTEFIYDGAKTIGRRSFNTTAQTPDAVFLNIDGTAITGGVRADCTIITNVAPLAPDSPYHQLNQFAYISDEAISRFQMTFPDQLLQTA